MQEQPQTIRHAQPLPSPSAQALSAAQSTTGVIAISAALLGILLVIFRDKLRLWNFGRQRPAGRWIRDRSLGGKMVSSLLRHLSQNRADLAGLCSSQ